MNIQRYIEQVIEDIDHLLEKDPPYKNTNPPLDFLEEMELFEDSILNNRGMPVVKYSSISKNQLPPAESLSLKQLRDLKEKILDLLQHCNLILEYPEQLPDDSVYHVIRENWETFILPESDFYIHHEFCDYDFEACPFPGFCNHCEELNNDIDEISEKEELP